MSVPPWPDEGTDEYGVLIGGTSAIHDSAALLDDGRVLYQYTTGDNLWQSYYLHWVAFLEANNALATAPYNIKSNISSSLQTPRSTVFRMPDGGLYMIIGYGLTGVTYFQMWRSSSGTGESSPGVPDWVLQSTIYAGAPYPDESDDWGQNNFGRAMAIGSRWIVTCPKYVPPGFLGHYENGLWRSENGAAGPWVNEFSMGYPGLGTGGYAASRQIVLHGGLYLWASSGNVNAAHCASSADGDSWSFFDIGGNSTTAEPLMSVDGTLYRHYSRPIGSSSGFPETSNAHVLASTGPATNGGNLILTFNLPGTGNSGTMYAVEGEPGKWAIIKQGRILMSRPSGWHIDSVAMG